MKLLFSVTLLVAVASDAIAGNGSGVFAHPEQYVGKAVTVCGYVEDRSEDRNIWVDRAHSDVHAMGTAILGHAPLTSWDGARVFALGFVFLGAGIVVLRRKPAPRKRAIPKRVRDAVIARDLSGDSFDPSRHHIDHIWPFSKGGSHTRDNLRVISKEKNLKKGAKHPKLWAMW